MVLLMYSELSYSELKYSASWFYNIYECKVMVWWACSVIGLKALLLVSSFNPVFEFCSQPKKASHFIQTGRWYDVWCYIIMFISIGTAENVKIVKQHVWFYTLSSCGSIQINPMWRQGEITRRVWFSLRHRWYSHSVKQWDKCSESAVQSFQSGLQHAKAPVGELCNCLSVKQSQSNLFQRYCV